MSEDHIWKVAQSVGFDDYELRPMLEAFAAALSQPAPAPQPAVPVVSDEQVRKTVESIQDPDTVPAFHNGYYTLTPDELRRAILALRPAVEPMTDEQRRFDAGCVVLQYLKDTGAPYRATHHMLIALHGDPEARGITAKAEGGA